MRFAPVTLSLLFSCAVLAAQTDATAKKPAASATAEARYKELTEKHTQLQKDLPKGRSEEATKARNDLTQVRVKDLEAFIAEFPKSPDATKARLGIASTGAQAARNKDLADEVKTALVDSGKKALEGIDAKSTDSKTLIQAAGMAGALNLDAKKTQFVEQAVAKATTFDDRLALVMDLKNPGLKETERADKLLAEVEKSAKTPEEHAALGMFTANALRRANNKDKDGYRAALAEVVKEYPATKSGKLAASKLAAAQMTVGSDPVAFQGTDLQGKPASLADYKGKAILVDFWAMWCGPCVGEIPNIVANYEKFHDKGFEVLGISLDRENEKERLEGFLKEHHMPWRQIYDGKYWSAEVATMYDVQSIPFAFLVGKDGKIAATAVRAEKLEPAIIKALGIEQ